MFTSVGLEPQGACSVARPRPTLCDPMDWSPPDSSVQGILQARALEQADNVLLQGIFPAQKSHP